MTEGGVEWHRWVYPSLSWSDITSMGVAWPQWVWCGLCGCSMGSMGVTWRKLVWRGLSRPECVCLWPQCMYLCLCRCSMASGCPKWVWHILSVWNGLSGCSMVSVVVFMASVGMS